MKLSRLSMRNRILVAGTLFGMFFGAGNLIFPVHLGQLAGRNLPAAMLGFIITAVGIPILGVAAIGNTHSDGLQALAGKVGRGYSYVFTSLLYLSIGPLFAIPRCATTSFTTGVAPMLPDSASASAALLLFSLAFFAAVLALSLRPGKITLFIGKIINPVFLVFLLILLLSALSRPGAPVAAVEPDSAYQSGVLFSALIEGYGTMDAIAGLAFGIVVIDVIRGMGIEEDGDVAKESIRSGLLTGILMTVIYVLTILMGAQSRGLFEISENGGIALAQIAGHYLGRAGSLILALTITFACLKTSIGLVVSCSEAFERMFPGKLSYRAWAILFTGFSFAISNVGLTSIISYSLPALMLLYPPAIVLILLALVGSRFAHDRAVYVSTISLTWAASLFDFFKFLPAPVQTALHLDAAVGFARALLPWFDLNLGWVVPAVLGFVIGLLIRRHRAHG